MEFRTAEQKRFYNILVAHMDNPDAPLLLEGTTGLGKTFPYLKASFGQQKRVALVYPTHQLIDQLLVSRDLKEVKATNKKSIATFKPRGLFETEEAYQNNKRLCDDADILLCTASSVMIDTWMSGEYNGSTLREIIIFDEADQLPQFAALSTDIKIDRCLILKAKAGSSTLRSTLDKLIASKNIPADEKARAAVLANVIDERKHHSSVGYSEEGDIVLKSKLPGRILKPISNRASSIFISATLSINDSFDNFKSAMGIENESKRSARIEPINHGSLEFEFKTDHEVGTEDWLDEVMSTINDSEYDAPKLVITPSFALSEKLAEQLENTVIRSSNETINEAVNRVKKDQNFIATGAWAGFDSSVVWKTIIIPRIPYPSPEEIYEEPPSKQGRTQPEFNPFSYFNSKNTAARRLKQAFGRGLRTPDATCTVVICDPRIENFKSVAPKRFDKHYHEGLLVTKTRTHSERDRSLRKDALNFYGHKCQAKCENKIISLRQLEVHHKNPLKDTREVKTKLEDVAVLCRNCHALAHRNDPPLTIEELIEINRNEANVLVRF